MTPAAISYPVDASGSPVESEAPSSCGLYWLRMVEWLEQQPPAPPDEGDDLEPLL